MIYLIDHQDFSHLDFSKLTLSIPKNTSHGDFSTNFALIVSSELKINPNKLAEKIADIIIKQNDLTDFDSSVLMNAGKSKSLTL